VWEAEARGPARQQSKGQGGLVDRALAHLWELGDHIRSGDPARWRQVYRRVVSRADLYFTAEPHGKYTRRPFEKAVVDVRPDREVFRNVPVGPPPETLRAVLPILAPALAR
jgi:hypothetical protein